MTTAAHARLSECLKATYREFASPAPTVIQGCPCCISNRGVDILLVTPLRELSGQQLWSYVSGAFLTLGGEKDFRYFLPRILDISVSDPANANDPEIVIGKLALAKWHTWSQSEQSVIQEFLDAWFEWALGLDLAEVDQGYIGTGVEGVLCGAARAGLPLQRWLLRLKDPLADPVFSDLTERFPRQLSPFWKDTPEGYAELATSLAQSRA